MTAHFPSQRDEATSALLEALARAMGARRSLLLPAGAALPKPRRSGFLRREEMHLLAVDVQGTEPPQRLVFELAEPPTLDDRLVATSLARALAPHPTEAPRRRGAVVAPPSLWQALVAAPDDRPEALLHAVIGATGAAAGALVATGPERRVWMSGTGRPVLRQAALEALDGPDGRVEVLGRVFHVRQLRWDAEVVGGIALEDPNPSSAAFAGGLVLLAAVLRPRARSHDHAETRADSGPDLRTVLSTLPIPAFAVDDAGRLLAASPEAERLLELTEFDFGARVTGRLGALNLDEVLRGGDVPDEIELGGRWHETASVALPSGGRLLVLSPRGAEEELRASQDDLVAAMAHELRTPIAGIKAFLEVLKMTGGKLDPARMGSMMTEGVREVVRLERLVEDLLLTSRIATGGIHARPDEIELRPVVDEVLRTLALRYPEQRFDVTGEGAARADPALIRHAVSHVLDNAAKFGAGEPVTVEVSGGERPEIRVRDRGPGIFSGDVADLFRPFQRLERNATSAHGGAGIGLYLAKAVVEANSGELTVSSRLGKGSTFAIHLPAAGSR